MILLSILSASAIEDKSFKFLPPGPSTLVSERGLFRLIQFRWDGERCTSVIYPWSVTEDHYCQDSKNFNVTTVTRCPNEKQILGQKQNSINGLTRQVTMNLIREYLPKLEILAIFSQICPHYAEDQGISSLMTATSTGFLRARCR